MRNGSTMRVPAADTYNMRLIPTITSNSVYAIRQQHNGVEQIHEKQYEFYASGVVVQDDRKQFQFSLGFLTVLLKQSLNFSFLRSRFLILSFQLSSKKSFIIFEIHDTFYVFLNKEQIKVYKYINFPTLFKKMFYLKEV
jgi:hypothetical protein